MFDRDGVATSVTEDVPFPIGVGIRGLVKVNVPGENVSVTDRVIVTSTVDDCVGVCVSIEDTEDERVAVCALVEVQLRDADDSFERDTE